jgi:hypothetical protein
MADGKPLSDKAIEARLGVALEALGHEPGETPVGDNAVRGARQVLLAFKMALLSRILADEQEPRSD